MGKLHTLKREIQRNPNKFFRTYGANIHKSRTETNVVNAAYFHKGKWEAAPWYWGTRAYRAFVCSILNEMGYKVKL